MSSWEPMGRVQIETLLGIYTRPSATAPSCGSVSLFLRARPVLQAPLQKQVENSWHLVAHTRVVQNELSLVTAVHLGYWSCKEFVQSRSESTYT